MKKVMASIGLMALASVSNAAVVDLGLHPFCNGNGDYLGAISFGGGSTFLRCELPTSIAVGNNTVVLAKNNQFVTVPIVWTLPGIAVVGNGNALNANPSTVDRTELRIEAGAQIAGAINSESALVISRGASINAVGSSGDPIIFSSLDDNYSGSNEWGGLVLAGFGESNNCPNGGSETCEMEGVAPGYYYGGYEHLDETMGSGTLQYVVIAEGGHEVAPASEINGLTLYSVNSGDDGSGNPTTVINNVHIHNNRDDGIEFFGGDVEVENLWLTCNEDDSVDWDEGYRGALSNVSILQDAGAGHAFELANNPGDDNAAPRALGMVANVTISYTGAGNPANVPFKLKEGTDAYFQNVVVGTGYDSISCDETSTAYSGGSAAFDTSISYGCTADNANASTSMHLPASGSATGFTSASFWSAPACD